jgi:hypothetical protein
MSNRPPPLNLLSDVAHAHAAHPQPAALLAALDTALQAALGYILFTVLVHDAAGARMRRIFTTHPDLHPVGGSKPIAESDWVRQVLYRGEPYIGRTREDLKDVFFDYEVLWSIGCGSVLNMPVTWSGKVLGSLNLLHQAGWYDAADIPTAQLFAQLALPAFLPP